MKIVSFNCNGLRARLHQIKALSEKNSDLVCLQEIKVHSDQFPIEDVQQQGFEQISHFGQKAYHGVATLANTVFTTVQTGFVGEDDAAQRRLIITEHALSNGKTLTVVNGYFPQGDNIKNNEKFPLKRQFYQDLMLFLAKRKADEYLIVLGDFNISAIDADIGIGDNNRKRWLSSGKCSFQTEERQWMQQLLDWGLFDGFRHCYPKVTDQFSWFDYRSKGFDDQPKRGLRIDSILVTQPLLDYIQDAGIDYDIRAMQKSSDHAPIWLRLDLELV